MTAGPIELVTRSAGETRDLGAAVAEVLRAGDVVSLTGDLGAGKTHLVQGAAGALGVEAPVSSPTFVLVREYRGALPVYHVDVYRLERIQDVLDLGFEDLLDPSGILFVEWGSAIDALLPDTHLEIALSIVDDDTRRVEIRGRGPGWVDRWPSLDERLGQWRAA
jgi:tRNA threonylcarbamoyladenosine biosynthesis protein TsaE